MYQLPEPEPTSEQELRKRGQAVFWEYVREVGENYLFSHGLDFDEAYDAVIYPNYEIELYKETDLGVDDEGMEILGEFLPKDNVALINKRLFERNDPRRVFTMSHEVVGHGILHGKFLRENARKYPKLHTTEEGIKQSIWKHFNTFEWQANTFAASFIAPAGYVLALYWKLFGTKRRINYVGPGRYSLCFNDNTFYVNVASPYQLAWIIAKRIKHYFWGLSTESLLYVVLEVAIETNGFTNRDFVNIRSTVHIGESINHF
jgi:hypothetical protein